MDYACTYDNSHWNGKIAQLEVYSGVLFYARLTGRSSGIDVICGLDPFGQRFICLPNHNAGCRLAALSNTLWNRERLTPLIGEVDAVTVANGLKHIGKHIEQSKEGVKNERAGQ